MKFSPIIITLFLSTSAAQSTNIVSSSLPSPGQAVPSLANADKQAMVHLMDLSGWKQSPSILMKECNRSDPAGTAIRQSAYDQWMEAHAQDWVAIENFEKQIIPKIIPAIGPTDPIKAVQAKTFINISRVFYFMKPEAKVDACTQFASPSGFLNDPAWKSESYAYLKQWVIEHQAER